MAFGRTMLEASLELAWKTPFSRIRQTWNGAIVIRKVAHPSLRFPLRKAAFFFHGVLGCEAPDAWDMPEGEACRISAT
jgi:hypothetical protein